jgi:GNAT superfamily N-acetyltransferase
MDATFAIEDPRGPELRALVDLLDRELTSRYPEASNLVPPDLAKFTPPGGLFVVARLGGRAIACGALIFVDARLAEVKRMFVHPDHRGKGLSRRVLADLEDRARGLGCTRMRLETGLRQPEAIALYRTAGYAETAKYAPYEDDPLSVCFSKAL